MQEHTIDPLEAYIAVGSDMRRTGTVVLASSPRVKKEYNNKTGRRLFESKIQESILDLHTVK
nr:hypothetical protein [uncultured Anaeromusa sp.]